MDERIYLMKPYTYISEVPGKNIRLAFIHALNLWLNLTNDKLDLIIRVVNMLHNSSLLIDDIEDNSDLRRGVPTAHKIYGIPMTINTANYMYFKALEELVLTNNIDVISVFTKEMNELHRGQGMDIFFRDNFICPTEEEYKIMVCKKTGGLFKLAYELMNIHSCMHVSNTYSTSSSTIVLELVENVGLYFQILDDYLNLKSGDYHDKKTFCEDLTEGKFSFPIVHSIRSNLQDRRLLEILKTKPTDIFTKQQALKLIESTKSFVYTIETLNDLHQIINKHIKFLGGNTLLEQIMYKCQTMLDNTFISKL